jgi:hypothetical protein
MDFFFSPVAGLASALILGPGPILPDLSDVFAADVGTSLTVEQRFSDPTTMPSIETLLAMPSGFRAAGYDALTISSSKSTAGDL